MIEFESFNSVSSNPTRICKCSNSILNCSIIELIMETFPGQPMILELLAVGQRYGTVKAFISANLIHKTESSSDNTTDNIGRIGEVEKIQTAERSCTSINYTIWSPNKRERLVITPFDMQNTPNFEQRLLKRNVSLATLFKQFSVIVKIKDCPLAFYLNSNYECSCSPSLALHNLNCDQQSLKILRSEQQWVGLTLGTQHSR